MNAHIIGTGSFLPEKVVTNFDLAERMETNDEWIVSRTGIRQRHIAVEESTAGMAAEAARRALFSAKTNPEHAALSSIATAFTAPSIACTSQAALGTI